ncbi:IS4 family transposase, partial [Actinopolymorpha pittospori]|uniref:IS4 family transposase n=1 Tax=Actinopolymorpha pittospori TaxID=648752 RepID=UPI003CD096D0
MPDTPENNAEFQHSSGARGDSAFPLVRLVGLAECGTHAIVAATMGSWSTGERTLVRRLLPALEPGMLVLADRRFYSYKLWCEVLEVGADLLFRVTSNMILPVLEVLPDGSYRSVLLDSDIQSQVRRRAKRRARPGDGPLGNPEVVEAVGTPCRVVEYHVDNGDGPSETFRLVTTILDHEDAPAVELAALYSERWEFEVALDEIEIHQLGQGRVLRSKSPEMVRQEI